MLFQRGKQFIIISCLISLEEMPAKILYCPHPTREAWQRVSGEEALSCSRLFFYFWTSVVG